ncbi:MAG: FAD-dependent oxidoreductase, partial [Lachnospiraceae bacterium]|nr:FAD-dependent oxidoreductase [Lachnospiraceae bacterium]
MKKRLLPVILSVASAMAFTLTANAYTAGTYTGTATGHNGPITVEVTVSEDAIEDITVTESAESAYIGEVASEHVIADVLEYQTLKADAVSGCTISRAGFVAAITDALTQADADIDALKAVDIPEKTGEERTIDTDVVVIGSGGAGLMAAIQAASDGADVVVLEKLARMGGSTLISSAMLVVGGSKLQEEAGIEDSVQNLKDYLIERGEGIADEEWINYYAENINEILEYYLDLGVNYNKDLVLIQGTSTIPRAHMPVESGRELIPRLVEEAEKNGVEILTETPAVSLIQDESGSIVGVNAENNGAAVTVNAKAVVIATGGYGWNEELRAEYAPDAADVWPVTSPGSTGDGLLMGMEVGADTVFKGGFIGWKVVSPAYGHTTAVGAPIYGAANLIVNANGDRFGDESLDYPFLYEEMQADGSDTFYFIFDSGDKETKDLVNNVSDTVNNLELGVEAGVAFKAETIEELAEVSGLADLADTVAAYNAAIEA